MQCKSVNRLTDQSMAKQSANKIFSRPENLTSPAHHRVHVGGVEADAGEEVGGCEHEEDGVAEEGGVQHLEEGAGGLGGQGEEQEVQSGTNFIKMVVITTL